MSGGDHSLYTTNFNSIKVQLKQVSINSKGMKLLFQFHKGTIKTSFRANLDTLERDFNSIKVQLKLE